MGELIQVQSFVQDKKVNEVIQQQINKRLKMYEGDFLRFEKYCQQSNRPINFASLESYLLETIEKGLKLSTFNRRSASVKYYLINRFKQVETPEQKQRIALLRQKYNDPEYREQKLMKGQSAK